MRKDESQHYLAAQMKDWSGAVCSNPQSHVNVFYTNLIQRTGLWPERLPGVQGQQKHGSSDIGLNRASCGNELVDKHHPGPLADSQLTLPLAGNPIITTLNFQDR